MQSRIDRERLRRLTGCNMDPGHVAAKIAWLRDHRPEQHSEARWLLLPGSFVAMHAAGEVAVDPSNASSSMLLDLHTRDWCGEACEAFEIDVDQLAPIRPAHAVLGAVSPWLRGAAGLDGSTVIVLGAGDEMAAMLGAGVVQPGTVCDVMGTAEPVCAVVAEPALDTERVTSFTRTPHPEAGCWKTPAGSRAVPTAGSETSSARSSSRARPPRAPTCMNCSTTPPRPCRREAKVSSGFRHSPVRRHPNGTRMPGRPGLG